MVGNTDDLLIRLPCFHQNPEVTTTPRGVLGYVAFDACAVLTNNNTPAPGKRKRKKREQETEEKPKKGKRTATATTDGAGGGQGLKKKKWKTINPADMLDLLPPGVYHFFQNANNKREIPTICSGFRDWVFPAVMPLHWRRAAEFNDEPSTSMSVVSKVVRGVDPVCAITKSTSARESCHLIPKAEEKWYTENRMGLRSGDLNLAINSINNNIALHGDLNKQVLDDGHFVFVPVLTQLDINPYAYDCCWQEMHEDELPEVDPDSNPEFMTFFTTPRTLDLAYAHHMRRVNLPARIPGTYLYSRFAYNVFVVVARDDKEGEDKDYRPPAHYRGGYVEPDPPDDGDGGGGGDSGGGGDDGGGGDGGGGGDEGGGGDDDGDSGPKRKRTRHNTSASDQNATQPAASTSRGRRRGSGSGKAKQQQSAAKQRQSAAKQSAASTTSIRGMQDEKRVFAWVTQQKSAQGELPLDPNENLKGDQQVLAWDTQSAASGSPGKNRGFAQSLEAEEELPLDINENLREEQRVLTCEAYDCILSDSKVPRAILREARWHGIFPGFSRTMRIAFEWRQANPIEVLNAGFARVGDEDLVNEGLPTCRHGLSTLNHAQSANTQAVDTSDDEVEVVPDPDVQMLDTSGRESSPATQQHLAYLSRFYLVVPPFQEGTMLNKERVLKVHDYLAQVPRIDKPDVATVLLMRRVFRQNKQDPGWAGKLECTVCLGKEGTAKACVEAWHRQRSPECKKTLKCPTCDKHTKPINLEWATASKAELEICAQNDKARKQKNKKKKKKSDGVAKAKEQERSARRFDSIRQRRAEAGQMGTGPSWLRS
ncbi:hypothetical protein DFH06DRAFT_1321964 [Mycena polygramma]|nr:hypothetical protein DFH06DRAFT_1321964 [Mycena polygramma]